MQNNVVFEPLVPSLYDQYINIGIKSYNQHYKHLWPSGDTTTYTKHSFTQEILLKEEHNPNTKLYLINNGEEYVGLVKITVNESYGEYRRSDVLFLDKIYILKEYSGQGIGAKSIQFLEEYARKLSKKVIFLESMQKGPAIGFYLNMKYSIVGSTIVPFKNVIEKEKAMYILMKVI